MIEMILRGGFFIHGANLNYFNIDLQYELDKKITNRRIIKKFINHYNHFQSF